jgi:hypothetical protein
MKHATIEIDPGLFTVIIQFEVDAGAGAAFCQRADGGGRKDDREVSRLPHRRLPGE